MSRPPPPFPTELWWMIIAHLRNERNPQHISRLAQTCKWFHGEVNDFLYQPVRFMTRENALRFAKTVENRPALKSLIKDIRHEADVGFDDIFLYSAPFYKQLSTFENLHTLTMRPRINRGEKESWLELWELLILEVASERGVWDYMRQQIAELWLDMDRDRFPGRFSDDPFGLGVCPWEMDIATCQHEIVSRTRFCDNYLRNSPPALRICHIGSCEVTNFFTSTWNCSIFGLSQLKTLCVSSSTFYFLHDDPLPLFGNLEELKLLNFDISGDGLGQVLGNAGRLKKFTLRGQHSSQEKHVDFDGHREMVKALNHFHRKSLESMDLDIYWGTPFGMDLYRLRRLKSLTVTPYAILGIDPESIPEFKSILPRSLERLVLRHEEGEDLYLSHLYYSLKSGGLSSLQTVTVQIPDITEPEATPISPDVWIEAESWKERFQDLEVTLKVIRTPYHMTVPEFDVCSCEALGVYHRFPFHVRPRLRPYPPARDPRTISHRLELDSDSGDSSEDDTDSDEPGHPDSEDNESRSGDPAQEIATIANPDVADSAQSNMDDYDPDDS